MISRGELLAKWEREGREKLGKALIQRKREFLIGVDSVREEEKVAVDFLAWHLVRRRKGARGVMVVPTYGDWRDTQRHWLGQELGEQVGELIVATEGGGGKEVVGEGVGKASDVVIYSYAGFLNLLDRCKGRIPFRFVVFMGFDEILTGVNSYQADAIGVYLGRLDERFRPRCLFLIKHPEVQGMEVYLEKCFPDVQTFKFGTRALVEEATGSYEAIPWTGRRRERFEERVRRLCTMIEAQGEEWEGGGVIDVVVPKKLREEVRRTLRAKEWGRRFQVQGSESDGPRAGERVVVWLYGRAWWWMERIAREVATYERGTKVLVVGEEQKLHYFQLHYGARWTEKLERLRTRNFHRVVGENRKETAARFAGWLREQEAPLTEWREVGVVVTGKERRRELEVACWEKGMGVKVQSFGEGVREPGRRVWMWVEGRVSGTEVARSVAGVPEGAEIGLVGDRGKLRRVKEAMGCRRAPDDEGLKDLVLCLLRRWRGRGEFWELVRRSYAYHWTYNWEWFKETKVKAVLKELEGWRLMKSVWDEEDEARRRKKAERRRREAAYEIEGAGEEEQEEVGKEREGEEKQSSYRCTKAGRELSKGLITFTRFRWGIKQLLRLVKERRLTEKVLTKVVAELAGSTERDFFKALKLLKKKELTPERALYLSEHEKIKPFEGTLWGFRRAFITLQSIFKNFPEFEGIVRAVRYPVVVRRAMEQKTEDEAAEQGQERWVHKPGSYETDLSAIIRELEKRWEELNEKKEDRWLVQKAYMTYREVAKELCRSPRSIAKWMNRFVLNPNQWELERLPAVLQEALKKLQGKVCERDYYRGAHRPQKILLFMGKGTIFEEAKKRLEQRCGNCERFVKAWQKCLLWHCAGLTPGKMTPLVRGREARVCRSATACEYYVRRGKNILVAVERFATWRVGVKGRKRWGCVRPGCKGRLRGRLKRGYTARCGECGTKYQQISKKKVRIEIHQLKQLEADLRAIRGYLPRRLKRAFRAARRPRVAKAYLLLDGNETRLTKAGLEVVYGTEKLVYRWRELGHVSVREDWVLYERLVEQGVSVSFATREDPIYEETLPELVEAVERARAGGVVEVYWCSLILSVILSTLDLLAKDTVGGSLLEGSWDFQARVKKAVWDQVEQVVEFFRRGQFDAGAFRALEARLNKIYTQVMRKTLYEICGDERIVSPEVGRTRGRKAGGRIFETPVEIAKAGSCLDAAANWAFRTNRYKLRTINARAGWGWRSVPFASHVPKDKPGLAAHLDFEEVARLVVRNRLFGAFLRGELQVEDFQEVPAELLFAIFAPRPRTMKRVRELVEQALTRDHEYGGRRMRVEKAHKSHVEQLVGVLLTGEEGYARYRPLVYQPARESLKRVEEVKQLGTLVQTYIKDCPWGEEVGRWFGKVWKPIEGWFNG